MILFVTRMIITPNRIWIHFGGILGVAGGAMLGISFGKLLQREKRKNGLAYAS